MLGRRKLKGQENVDPQTPEVLMWNPREDA